MSVRRSEFSFPSSNLSTDAQKHVDKDANRLDQDYIDEICIDYIQDGESYEEEYNCDDCDSIPSGVTIRISKIWKGEREKWQSYQNKKKKFF